MDLKLKYGRELVSVEMPDKAVVITHREPEKCIDKQEFLKQMTDLLPSDNNHYNNIAIVVSDKTRLCAYPLFLPWLTEILEKKGAGPANITFYIAYGTHARQTDDECRNAYGPVYNSYRFIHHDCGDDSLFEESGSTSRGTPVTIRKDIIASSLVITFGAISHHYFAGFGGGRKMLFPGLAARKAIYHNHGLFLDRTKCGLAEGCQPGKLTGNPVADDLFEIEDKMPERISIHAILNSSGEVCRLITGSSREDFLKACEVHDSCFCHAGEEQFDLVIASSGGYPKDINFIQAHKSVHNASAFVKDGGRLIIMSECADGIGSDYFLKYFNYGSFEEAFSVLEEKYEGNGGTALSMMLKTKRIGIIMLTSLSEELCSLLGVKKSGPEEIAEIIKHETGSIAAILNASMTVRNLATALR